ncbi:MAG: hypothetical protein AVDCRST_MAG85-894, partial [uncultured Solirubrobacteraceae bacterium]
GARRPRRTGALPRGGGRAHARGRAARGVRRAGGPALAPSPRAVGRHARRGARDRRPRRRRPAVGPDGRRRGLARRPARRGRERLARRHGDRAVEPRGVPVGAGPQPPAPPAPPDADARRRSLAPAQAGAACAPGDPRGDGPLRADPPLRPRARGAIRRHRRVLGALRAARAAPRRRRRRPRPARRRARRPGGGRRRRPRAHAAARRGAR